MKRLHMYINVFATILVVAGVSMLAFILYSQRSSVSPVAIPKVAAVAQQRVIAPETIHGIPVTLKLPSLDKVFELKTGTFNTSTRSWTLSSDTAYYADLSNPANNFGGTTLIYGHNRANVFSKLSKLQTGDRAIIETDNEHTFTYSLQSTTVVSPEETDLAISNDGKPRLVLQTCTGLFWEKRQLFIFALERVE